MNVHHDFQNKSTAWSILNNEHIYGNIYNFQITSKYSKMIDSLVSAGCTTSQIYLFFQNLGMNVYEDQIVLYLKYGITIKSVEELPVKG